MDRFGHPEGGNMDHDNKLLSNKETSQRQGSKDCEEFERKKRLIKDRESIEKSTRCPKAGGDQRTPPKMRRSTKQCRSGPSCTWKPLCLFLHKVGVVRFTRSSDCLLDYRCFRREETITSLRIRTSLPRRVERSKRRKLGLSRRLLKRF